MAKKSGHRHTAQQKKEYNQKKVEKTDDIITETVDTKSVETSGAIRKNAKLIAAIPFGIAIIIYALIWIIKPGEPVVDPWFAAVKLVDSSNRVQDPAIKAKLMNEGGNELRRLVKLHPYHARVHYYLGYYFFLKQDWDSSMIELKEASRIDSGSTINSIWPNAHDLIVKTSVNQSLIYRNAGNPAKAKEILLEAYPYYPNHPLLNKHLGSVCYDTQDFEGALRYFTVSLNGEPKDYDVSNMIGVLFKMKGDLNNAAAYFNKTLQLNPNHAGARMNLESLGKK